MNYVCAYDKGTTELPTSSAEFFASFSCDNFHVDDSIINEEEDDSFFRWVLPARHTTWHPGWEVPLPQPNTQNVTGVGGEKYYARVFDLLNWSRKQNSLPVLVDISSICHKGMELQYMNGIDNGNNHVPPTQNEFIPSEMWSNLWNTCGEKLRSTNRISSSCIDIPGLIVVNPNPPLKINNPCHLEYRMVDGAHRICLRKYLLALLTGELAELEGLLIEGEESHTTHSITDDKLYATIQEKHRLINRTTYGMFLVMNQTTFQSMLMSSDPFTTWAKDQENLRKGITAEFQLEWNKWMLGVMDRVGGRKTNEYCESSCSDFSGNDVKPNEEL